MPLEEILFQLSAGVQLQMDVEAKQFLSLQAPVWPRMFQRQGHRHTFVSAGIGRTLVSLGRIQLFLMPDQKLL